jgi:hypothetical protein
VSDGKSWMKSTLQDVSHSHGRFRKLMLDLDVLRWYVRGRPYPPPKIAKYKMLKSDVKRLNLEVVIETGTYLGDLVAYMTGSVETIYSIEISNALFDGAKKRFRRRPGIYLELGDSSVILPRILANIEVPCLFWLDAHFSGGITLGDQGKSPIMEELRIILDHSLRHGLDHLVMIDDARDFVGKNGYPTVSEVDRFVKNSAPNWIVNVHDDMIQVCNSNLT